ncbi:hypothetical protein BS78_07G214300 [Paspalum vaginatum]|nr:hypothetical protein BS78_07G214300 [Paspalum vaginatum]
MGGLMSSKQKVQEWEAIAECNINDTNRGKEEVLPILKLSYKHLPPEMKQRFAFCAVFPKDYVMEKDKLIELWISNGFILEDGIMDLTQKAEQIFNELAWRSFVQDVNAKNFYGCEFAYRTIGCKMHDLMHDLAKDISVGCANTMELIQGKKLIQDVHHMQISSCELENISGLLKGASSLRTLLTRSGHQNIKDLKMMSLRALRCKDPSIISSQLVNKAHLRYLLSESYIDGSHIDRLPDSICMLYNLISLRLNGCQNLRYLPDGMTSLRKLRHLHLLNCENLERMPPKLSLLHNLCILSTFVVGTEEGCGIEELKDLQLLSHKLELYKLRNVKSGSKVNLHEKRISELLLDWDHRTSDTLTNDEVNHEAAVLESLVPPRELESLEIRGYYGLSISQWMRDPQIFRCLRKLIISNFRRCEDLPIVWLSSSLEHVSLSGMDSLTTLCKNIDVDGAESISVQVFPRLKEMKLKDLPNLERWTESSAGEPHKLVMFPRLEKLEVLCCSKLVSLPEAPFLRQLSCRGDNSAGVRPMSIPLCCWPSLDRFDLGLRANVVMSLEEHQGQSQTCLENLRYMCVRGEDAFISTFNLPKLRLGLGEGLACLVELSIMDCWNIVSWPVEELRYLRRLRFLHICGFRRLVLISSKEILSLPLLENLVIDHCDSLQEIQELPTSLKLLSIGDCQSLVSLPSNLGNLANLRFLSLSACGGIQALPDGMNGLTSLEQLWIWSCKRIEKFPPGLLQRLPHLKKLSVHYCPRLQRRCREGGEYFDLISSVTEKSIQ